MDGPQEYEVESVTRARVHDKKGKKIAWRYYVKWKGYGWDECTWEPTESFQGSEHILETFWERIDTGGRDISDATAFKKGEELLISGPPGKKGLKRKVNPAKTRSLPSSNDIPSSNGATISAPPLAARKRRRVQIAVGDEHEHPKRKRRVSTAHPKNGATSSKSSRRRRASSPGPRKSASRRLPSAGDSQLDADGETDPDIVEVEDELMQVSAEDAEDNKAQLPATANGSANGKKITFDDLEHFYTGNPIDIDQNTDEQVAGQKQEDRPRVQSPSLAALALLVDDPATEPQAPVSPTHSSSDPLFDSPSQLSHETTEVERGSIPAHRARAANPLVKLIDTTALETTDKQSRITAKARLISMHTTAVPSASSSGRGVDKQGGKPGPSRSSAGLVKNRSSLLTAAKGALKSVKGKFSGTAVERDHPDEIEDAPVARGTIEGDKPLITSWSDEDDVDDHRRQVSNSQPSPPPSGEELLKLAGLQADMETLPDYEDDPVAQPQDQGSSLTSAPVEEGLCNQSSAKVTEENGASDHVAENAVPGTEEKAQTLTTDVPSISSVVPHPVDEAVKRSIELAKEHLFPSAQSSFHGFSSTQSSFRSTIFGPLYQGLTVNRVPPPENELRVCLTVEHLNLCYYRRSTTFKVIFGDGVEVPLALKDCSEIKGRVNDILVGNYSGKVARFYSGKVALFYSAKDALAMVSTFKSDSTARVVLDACAETVQQERFSTFLQHFESSQTLVAPVGEEVCVLYSSKNIDISERLGVPARLRGLSSTLLISHAAIEDQLAYVAAAMKATPL